MTATNKLISCVRALAAQNYVGFKHLIRTRKSWIHNYSVEIRNQFHGGNSLTKLCGDCDLALVECGANGRIFAVIPYETLLSIMQQSEPKAELEPSVFQ
jgi:hypothetical protein